MSLRVQVRNRVHLTSASARNVGSISSSTNLLRLSCFRQCQPYSTDSQTSIRPPNVFPKVALAFALAFVVGWQIGKHSPSAHAEKASSLKTPPGPAVGGASGTLGPDGLASTYASPLEIQFAIAQLRELLPGQGEVETDPEALKGYVSHYSYHPSSLHAVVVRVKSTEDVVKVVNVAREYRVPIVAYSGATSLEGHFDGYRSGSICLDMSGMDQILEIHEDDADLVCQAGARWEDINQALEEKGIPLFFPLDPGPGATIGGMIGTGCSGTNAVRYGTARGEWFLNVTAVLPSGEVIKTRRRARKSATGPDMTKLFVGAEGTLGIITEVTLRLTPRLPTKVAMAQFANVQHAVDAVQEILNTPYGANIQCIELLDDQAMQTINDGGLVEAPYPVVDTLFFKIQGDTESIQLASQTIQKIVQAHGSSRFEFAATEQAAEEMWQNRKYALTSSIAVAPDHKHFVTDVCVPVSQLPRLVYETKKDLAETGIKSTIAGHVGDGNFHALLLFKGQREEALVRDAAHRLVQRALALDGTCSGEHGIGLGKKKYLTEELGEGTVELMRSIKKTIDPFNIFNPGKLYPDLTESKPVKS